VALFAVRYNMMLFCSSTPKAVAAARHFRRRHSRPVDRKGLNDPAHAPIRI